MPLLTVTATYINPCAEAQVQKGQSAWPRMQ